MSNQPTKLPIYLSCSITGVNIGAPCEFTSLSVLLSNHDYLKRLGKKSGEKYAKENLIGYGIVSSFVSAVAQAYYQGKLPI